MLRGIYSSATGMIAQARRLDVLSNNLANASTVGYKREETVSQAFQDLLQQRLDDHALQDAALPTAVGPVPAGTALASATRLTDGPLQATGRPLDVAIQGDGFFSVQTPQGVRYTRAGSFIQDHEGALKTAAGYPVLVNGAPVAGRDVEIRDDGSVWVDGQRAGELDIVTSQEVGPLRKVGGNLWAPDGAGAALVAGPGAATATPAAAAGAGAAGAERPWRLKVGFLEASNVDPLREMVGLIETTRWFEYNQQALQMQDQALGRAVNDLARR